MLATARTDADLAALAAEGIEAFQLDYRDATSIATLFETVMAATGGTLDAVFNNGAYSQPGAVEDLPVEALREQFEANVFGWHDLTRRIVPVMRAQGHGRIVQCSSILGLVPMPYRGAYNASKHAIEALSLTMRMELTGSGIHVSLIEPGPIESKIAINALRYVDKYIDIENSVHRPAYEKQLARLRQGGVKSKNKLGPDAVHAVLTHALNSPKPRPHYAVTRPAKLGVAMKRILPAGFFYNMLARQEP